jgi:PAS domain S-box-containing protein
MSLADLGGNETYSKMQESRIKSMERENQDYKNFLNFQGAVILVMFLCTAGLGFYVFRFTPSAIYQQIEDLSREVSSKSVESEKAADQVQELAKSLEEGRKRISVLFGSLEASNDPFVALDRNGNIILWSKGAGEFFGIEKQEALGYDIAFMVPVDGREEHRKHFDDAMSRPGEIRIQTVRCNCIVADGVETPVEISTWTVPGEMAVSHFKKQVDKIDASRSD